MSHLYKERAGFFIRVAAAFVDSIILGIINFIGTLIAIFHSMSVVLDGHKRINPEQIQVLKDLPPEFLVPVSVIVFINLVYLASEIFLAATPAKMLLRIQIRMASGVHAPISILLYRFLLKQGGLLFCLVGFFLSLRFIILMGTLWSILISLGALLALSRKKRSLHDRLSGTAVYSTHFYPGSAKPEERLESLASANRERQRANPNEVLGRRW